MKLVLGGAIALLLALVPTARADVVQTRDDPSDAPASDAGKTDIRTVTWTMGDAATTLHVALDASLDAKQNPADIGLHVLLDTGADGIADVEVAIARTGGSPDATWDLRSLNGKVSSATCQDLAGTTTSSGTAAITTAGGLESIDVSLKAIPATFTWVAFGQTGSQGPWDYLPDAANPDTAAPNPGTRSCDANGTGIAADMSKGVAFPDATPTPTPTPSPSPTPTATPTPTPPAASPTVASLVVNGSAQAGSVVQLDASGTKPATGAHIVAYQWDMDGDGRPDTNTGTHSTANALLGSHAQTVVMTAIDSLGGRASATVTMQPSRPAPGCETETSIGLLRIRAACITHPGGSLIKATFARVPGFYPTRYMVSMNGTALVSHDPHAEIAFDTTNHVIDAYARTPFLLFALNTPVGDIDFGEFGRTFHWPFPQGAQGGHVTHLITIGAAPDHCEEDVPPDACGKAPGGFPISGSLDLGIDTTTYEAVLAINCSLQASIGVTGHLDLRFGIVRGLVLEGIGFGIQNATLGPLQINNLAFHYSAPGSGDPPLEGDSWNAAGDVNVVGAVRVRAFLQFINGQFNYARANLRLTPGIPIYAGVFLNRFAGEFGINPFRLGVGVGINVETVIQIDADTLWVQFNDHLAAIRMDGDMSIYGNQFAHAYAEYWTDGYFDFGGKIGYQYPGDVRAEDATFALAGETDFWLEDQHNGGPSLYQGTGSFTVKVYDYTAANVRGVINNHWMAGCLGHIVHAAHSVDDGRNQTGLGCDLEPFSLTPTRTRPPLRPAGASQVGATLPDSQAFTVPAGRRALVMNVFGKDGAPKVTLVDPKGHQMVAGTQAGKLAEADGLTSMALPQGNLTMLRVERPAAGEWRLQPAADSVAVDRVESTDALPALKVSARVLGSGHRRMLTWRASGLGGRRLQFVERGRNAGQTIATTKAASGRAAFTPQDGSAGTRRIEAQVTGPDGTPLDVPVVARYRAPGPLRPARPARVRVARKRGDVIVSWKKVRAADGYIVRVTGAGRRERYSVGAKARSVRVPSVSPATALKITVAGFHGDYRQVGPARKAALRRVKGAR